MTDENAFGKSLSGSPFLIMSHRGFWGGNIIQNTMQSAQLAYTAGADIVEIDICQSSDGVYYLFHDGGELGLLGIGQPFSTLSSEVIDGISVLNSLGSPSGYFVQRLDDFLEWLPEGHLVNIDRSWKYWQDQGFFDLLHNSGKADYLVLKSPVDKLHLDNFEGYANGLAYMPIVYRKEEIIEVLLREGIQTVGVEIIPTDEDSELLDSDLIAELRNQGLFIMANAEKLGQRFNLFAGFDDDKAVLGEGWREFVERGVNVIQTDWPNFLFDYREMNGDAIEILETGVTFRNYDGLVDPTLLRPLIGSTYAENEAFDRVLDLLNNWQMASAMVELERLEDDAETMLDALRLKAEVLFIYEDHQGLMEVVEAILAYADFDLQALWLDAISSSAKAVALEDNRFINQLAVNHPDWNEIIVEYLAMIDYYSTYDTVVSDDIPSLDVIAIYGFGLSAEGYIPQALQHRLLKGVELLNLFPEAKVIVSGGAVSTPFNEAKAMERFLLERGISPDRIILEPLAKDTVGNSQLMAPMIKQFEFQSCCVLTSITHLPRAYLSLLAALKDIDYSLDVYGAAYETKQIELPIKEKQLFYSTVFRAANLYSKEDLESGIYE